MADQPIDPIAASDAEIAQYLADTGCAVSQFHWGRFYRWSDYQYGVSSEWIEDAANRDAVNARLEHQRVVESMA